MMRVKTLNSWSVQKESDYYMAQMWTLRLSKYFLTKRQVEEGKLLNSFYEATITLIPKPDKDHKKKKKKKKRKRKLQANITDEHRCKTP